MSARRRIVIQPYDIRWPAQFEAIAAHIRRALGRLALRVDHIGSTSVPDLAAKDIIDVQVSVADLDDPAILDGFNRLGAAPTTISADHVPADHVPADHVPAGRVPPKHDGDPGRWRKLSFRPPATWRPTHLHVRAAGSPNERYALLFRDYLRATPSAAAAYGQVKVALARLHPDDAAAYYDVKDPVCDLVIDAAELWATDTGWSVPGPEI